MKVVTVVGNRPQFKPAPLSLTLCEGGIEEVAVHTGQHYDRALSQVFFDELAFPEPKHRLDLHTADPDVMAPAIAAVVRSESPDVVLVYGDTDSTPAGARASVSVGVPVGHVELLIDLRCVSFDNERAAFAALSSMGGAGLEPAATCV